MEIKKIYKLSGIVVWAGLCLVPMAAHADIMVTVSCGSISASGSGFGGSGLGGGPSGTVTCLGLSSLSSATLNYSTSVSGAMPGTTGGPFPVSIPFAADMFFTPTGPSGVTWPNTGPAVSPSLLTVVVPGSNTDTAMAGVTDANFSSGFNVGVSTDIFDGSATSMTGAVSVTYDSLLASLGLAPAVTASCGSVTGSGLFGGPSGTVTCPAYTPPSYTTSSLMLKSVTVNDSTSVTGAMPGTTGGQFPASIPFAADMFFTATGSNGVTWSGNSVIPNQSVVGVSGSDTQTATAGVTVANFSSGFNVGIFTDVFDGSANSMTGAVSVTYDFGPAAAAVPEPSSMPLLLSGLFVLFTAEAIRKRHRRAVA